MQIVQLQFPFRLHAGDIPGFRAAIAETVGIGQTLFHNHDNREQGESAYHWAYPLVQYSVRGGQACVTGAGQGAQAIIRHLLPLLPDVLYIQGIPYATTGYRFITRDWEPEWLETPKTIGLYHWLPLNANNYQRWKDLEGQEQARQELLQQCLYGHFRSLLRHLAPTVDTMPLEVAITAIQEVKRVQWHQTQLVRMNIQARTNLLPPRDLGLGRCAAFGFGEPMPLQKWEMLVQSRQEKEYTSL